ncbi:peroxiredoxin-2E-2, chloroplastic-like [Zingiber officinale]|uniref:peroxiredoxin-2E-2, chloroplastic-like n=1 Tax=Zingiber officinale TaxID=94328 RepID=UPI001C4CAFAD|nr:peroxiredoxin-2E-2, chloroplastic-like [Zingiber officinale]
MRNTTGIRCLLVIANISDQIVHLKETIEVSISDKGRPRVKETGLRPPLKFSRSPPSSPASSASAPAVATTISVRDNLLDANLSYFGSDGELQTVTISDLTKGKKAIFFAIPGIFTSTCSQKHLPGFVEKAGELHAKGMDTIAYISVNNAFVMHAWKKDLNIRDEVFLLSDGNREFTRARGVELDLSDKPMGLGVRSRRYALLPEDRVVKVLNLEDGGAFTFNGAEDLLKVL